MEVTGIDAVGGSLLARQSSQSRRSRDRYKKEAKTQQKMAIFNGLLRFADGAIQERHNNWAENESSRTVQRLLKKQSKMNNQRQSYLDALEASGQSAYGFELGLVEKQLDNSKLSKYIEGFEDLSDGRKRQITYGTGKEYNPETNNVMESGIYKALARQRLDARDVWGKQLNDVDVDVVGTANNWKKVNPYSKNLLSGAFNILKNTITGTPKANTQAAQDALFNSIKEDTDKLERFRKVRAAGFNMQDAIQKVSDEIVLTSKDKLGKIIGPIEYFAEESEVSEPYEYLGKKLSRDFTKKTYLKRITYENSFRETTTLIEKLNASDRKAINPTTGKPFTAQEIETSKGSSLNTSQTYEVDQVGDITGGNTSYTLKVFFKDGGIPHDHIITAKDPQATSIELNPNLTVIPEERLNNHMLNVNALWKNIVPFVEDVDSAETYLTNFAITQKSDDKNYANAMKNLSGGMILIANKIKDFTEGSLGFNENTTDQIALQIHMMDKYAQEELLSSEGRKTLNGEAYLAQEVDPTKILLAIDLLRAKGSLGKYADNEIVTSANLQKKLKKADFAAGEDGIAGNPENEDGERFFDANQGAFIKTLRKHIDKLDGRDGKNSTFNKQSILDIPVEVQISENGETTSHTVYNLMLGEKLNSEGDYEAINLTQPNVTKPTVVDPAINTETNIQDQLNSIIEVTANRKVSLLGDPNRKSGLDRVKDASNNPNVSKIETAGIFLGSILESGGRAVAQDIYNMYKGGIQNPAVAMYAYVAIPPSEQTAFLDRNFSSTDGPNYKVSINEDKLNLLLEGLDAESSKEVRKFIDNKISKNEAPELKNDVSQKVLNDVSSRYGGVFDSSEKESSLLSKPTPDTDSSISDKLDFVANAFGDGPNERAMMQELIWVESKDGTAQGTYEIDSKGQGSFGVAQVDRKGFDQVQKKINDPKSKYAAVAASFKENAEIDLATTKYEDLNNDLLSIIYGRLYLAQITTDPIPDTVEGRAAYWKLHYNTKAGDGTPKKYIDDVESR